LGTGANQAAAGNHSHSAGNLDSLSDVIITAPSATEVLKYNGTNWVNATDATGGGGGSPAGNSGEFQYNNAGAFAGAANVEHDAGNLKLVSAAIPSAPTGGLVESAFNLAGQPVLHLSTPFNAPGEVYAGWTTKTFNFFQVLPGTTATAAIGMTVTTSATMSSQQTVGSTSKWQRTWRKRYTSAGTAGSATGVRAVQQQWYRGATANAGGFFFHGRCGISVNTTGFQAFFGLSNALGALAGDPSALTNMCGVGYDAADASTGNWFFMRNDAAGTATKVDLGTGMARGITEGLELVMYCKPNDTVLYVWIKNTDTGTVVLDTSYNTDLPAATTQMGFNCQVRNGAVASATGIEHANVYIIGDC
jgi:hypothetical protein